MVSCIDAHLLKQPKSKDKVSKTVPTNATQTVPSLPRALLGAVGKVIGLGGNQAGSGGFAQRATDALRVCNAAKYGDLEVSLNSRSLESTIPSEQCHEFLTPVDRGDTIALRLSYTGQGGEVNAVADEVLDEPILYLIGTPVDEAACGEECQKSGRKASYLIHQFYARHDGLNTAQVGFMDAQIGAAAAELTLRGEVEVPTMKDRGIRHISPGKYNAVIRSRGNEVSKAIHVVQGECYVIVRSESGNIMVFPDSRPENLKSSSRFSSSAVGFLSFFAISVIFRLM
jgi:hypothetical protein